MASVTFKFFQNETVREDGTQLVMLRITYQRKHKYVGTGVYVREKHFNPDGTYDKENWIRKSFGDSAAVATQNGILKAWLDKGDAAKRFFVEQGRHFTVADVRQRLESENEDESFSDFMAEAIQQYHDRGQLSVYRNHETILKRLRQFFKVDEKTGNVFLHQLTRQTVTQFETFLLTRPSRRHSSTDASRRNTVSSYLSWFHQHIMAYIIKHNLPSEYDPLRGAKFPHMESEVTCLTQGELYMIQTAILPTKTKGERTIENCRNVYLTSYFLHGLRAGDVVGARVSQLQTVWQMENGKPVQSYRFYSLTQKRNKVKSVIIEEAILPMLLRYAEGKQPDDFLFPFLPAKCKHMNEVDLMESIRNRIVRINCSLKTLAERLGIKKRLTMHSARHTFAEMLYGETGDLRLVSDALTHSRFDTTQKYLRRGQINTDRANQIYSRLSAAPAEETGTETMLKQNPETGEANPFGDVKKTG